MSGVGDTEADEEGIEASRAQGGRVGLGQFNLASNPMRMEQTAVRSVEAVPPSEDDPDLI